MPVLTALEAKNISLQYDEMKDVMQAIKKHAEEGYVNINILKLSSETILELEKLGYVIIGDSLRNGWDINWSTVEKISSSEEHMEYTHHHDFSKEVVKIKNIHGDLIWSSSNIDLQNENERKQKEVWINSEKQKARYEATTIAEMIHDKSGYTNPSTKATEEFIETCEVIYKWLIHLT